MCSSPHKWRPLIYLFIYFFLSPFVCIQASTGMGHYTCMKWEVERARSSRRADGGQQVIEHFRQPGRSACMADFCTHEPSHDNTTLTMLLVGLSAGGNRHNHHHNHNNNNNDDDEPLRDAAALLLCHSCDKQVSALSLSHHARGRASISSTLPTDAPL